MLNNSCGHWPLWIHHSCWLWGHQGHVTEWWCCLWPQYSIPHHLHPVGARDNTPAKCTSQINAFIMILIILMWATNYNILQQGPSGCWKAFLEEGVGESCPSCYKSKYSGVNQSANTYRSSKRSMTMFEKVLTGDILGVTTGRWNQLITDFNVKHQVCRLAYNMYNK